MSKDTAIDGGSADQGKKLRGTSEVDNTDQADTLEIQKSRDDVTEHQQVRELAMETPNTKDGVYSSVQTGPSTLLHPSTPPLEEIKQLYLSDLRRDSHHPGGYVLLKVTSPPMTMAIAIHFIGRRDR